ncbi:MAG: glutamyl-tRNA synthetase, partial [Frankiales bacterium]|nr:glutamyl-tRNA synthetase [Frankiales bacterium]
PGYQETPVVRLLVPDDAPLTFVDVVRGEVSAPRPDDQVLLKGDGFPTYHLAVVVDDHLMGITHVVRGEEWISSTPKHLLLFDMLGWERPQFAHMPLLRNVDKSKISKRKNPAARLTWFQEQGYLPEALLNFLGLLGYSQPDGSEVFTFADMSRDFDWSRVNTVGPVFDLDKLLWLNGHYLRELPAEDLVQRMLPFLHDAGLVSDPVTPAQLDDVRRLVPLVQTRFALLSEAPPLCRFLLVDEDAFTVDDDARAKNLGEGSAEVLTAAAGALEGVQDWSTGTVQAALDAALVEGLGLKRGKAYAPVRAAVLGALATPPLPESMELLGRERTLRRLRAAAIR